MSSPSCSSARSGLAGAPLCPCCPHTSPASPQQTAPGWPCQAHPAGLISGNLPPRGTLADPHTPLTAPKWHRGDERPCNIDGAVLCQHTLYPCESCSAHTPSGPSEPLADGFAHRKCSLSSCQPQAFTFPVVFGAYNVFGLLKHHSSLYSSCFGTAHPFPARKVSSNGPFTGVPEQLCKDQLCLCLPRCVRHLPGSGPLTCSQQLDGLMLTQTQLAASKYIIMAKQLQRRCHIPMQSQMSILLVLKVSDEMTLGLLE